jgi:hypothetical protein
LGYEDLNDHDELRRDPLLAVLAEKEDPRGESRARERDGGKALAGKSTLNRLELTPEATTIRLKVLKIGALVRVTVRKVGIALAGGYPYAERWARIWGRLQQLPVGG